MTAAAEIDRRLTGQGERQSKISPERQPEHHVNGHLKSRCANRSLGTGRSLSSGNGGVGKITIRELTAEIVDSFRQTFEFPLIQRELTEQSQKRRTYALRAVCVAVFTLVFLVTYASIMLQARNLMWILGQGREMVTIMFVTVMLTLYALGPAMTCGAITTEKEKQTLGLLMISRLRPGGLVFEKMVSRALPLISLLVASSPLFAICYLFGGLTLQETLVGVLIVGLVLYQIICVAVFSSAILETSIAAFWMTYVILAILYFGWPVLHELGLLPGGPSLSLPDTEFLFFPVYIMAMLIGNGDGFEHLGMLTIPSVVVSTLFVVAARFAVIYFGFGGAWSLEKIVRTGCRRIITLIKRPFTGRAPVPDEDSQAVRAPRVVSSDRPLSWRETRSGLINNRWVQAGCVIGVLLLEWMILASENWDDDLAVLFHVLAMIIAMLLVMSISCRLFGKERERQTLDSLLVTPLGNREILSQKLSGTHSVMWVLLGVLFVQCLINLECTRLPYSTLSPNYQGGYYYGNQNRPDPWTFDWITSATMYMICSLGNSFIYMNLIKWISVFFGLRLNTQIKAMVATLVTVLLLCFIPLILTVLTMMLTDNNPDDFPFFAFTSPIIIQGMNEWHEFYQIHRSDWLPTSDTFLILTNFAVYGGLALLVRSMVLSRLSQLMSRIDVDSVQSMPLIPRQGPLGQQLY